MLHFHSHSVKTSVDLSRMSSPHFRPLSWNGALSGLKEIVWYAPNFLDSPLGLEADLFVSRSTKLSHDSKKKLAGS